MSRTLGLLALAFVLAAGCALPGYETSQDADRACLQRTGTPDCSGPVLTAGTGGIGTGGVATGGTGGVATGGTAGTGGASCTNASDGVCPVGCASDPDCVPPYTCGATPAVGSNYLIENLEDGDSAIALVDGRQGNWYAFNSGSPGTQSPTPGTAVLPALGTGANGTSYAVETSGSGFPSTGYAGIGFTLNGTGGHACPYNASSMVGISLWLRGSAGTQVRIQLPTVDTMAVPLGGTCVGTSCNDSHGFDVTLTADWTGFVLPWAAFTQEGWGAQTNFDPAKLLRIEAKVAGANASNFDVSMDEIYFVPPGRDLVPNSGYIYDVLAGAPNGKAILGPWYTYGCPQCTGLFQPGPPPPIATPNPQTGQMCFSGTLPKVMGVPPDYNSYWGEAIAFDVCNTPRSTAPLPAPLTLLAPSTKLTASSCGLDITSLSFTLSGPVIPPEIDVQFSELDRPSTPAYIRVLSGAAGTSYTAGVADARVWYDSTLPGTNAADIQSIAFSLPSTTAGPVPFDFCVSNVTLTTN